MTLAKAPRSPLKDKNSFETAVLLTKDHDTPDATGTTNYLTECRKRKPLLVNTYKERCHINTSTNSKKDVTNGNEDDDDVIIISSSSPAHSQEEASVPRSHLKLLQFCDNHRPAYFGTWNKKSKTVSARNPFRKDEVRLYKQIRNCCPEEVRSKAIILLSVHDLGIKLASHSASAANSSWSGSNLLAMLCLEYSIDTF